MRQRTFAEIWKLVEDFRTRVRGHYGAAMHLDKTNESYRSHLEHCAMLGEAEGRLRLAIEQLTKPATPSPESHDR